MPTILTNTPLSALQALALDTETTGLDVRQARVIEIGIAGYGLPVAWSSLVNPGIPIPARSTGVHGIDDAMVAAAPGFGNAWRMARAILADHIIIGHSLGFDLAVLKRSCEREGLAWSEPLWLDTRFLAILLEARLPDFSLGALGAWLELPPLANHRALADAEAAAAVLGAMVPRLRARGIHTVGEALAACRRIEGMSQDLSRAGWAGPPPPSQRPPAEPRGDGRPSGGFDAYPFQHRVEALMSAPPLFIAAAETVGAALQQLTERQVSGLFVGDPARPAGEAGIVTERDILRALARQGATALDGPVDSIATRPLVTIRSGAFVYRAIGTMARLGIRHLAVVGDDHARIVGALSQRDLLRLRAQSALLLGDEIDVATCTADLGRGWAKLPVMAQALVQEGLPAADVAGIIARELGALTRRAAMLAEQAMVEAGHGAAPVPYGVLVLGSAGRGESLLAMDQDNAIIFAEGEPGGHADRWFAALGARFAAMLHEVGVPLCKGGVMAREAAFRGSVATWRERMEHWLGRSSPEDLLNVDIVFDARTVHGDPELFQPLLERFAAAASQNAAFLKLLIASHPDAAVPLGFFGALKGDADGRLDLKRHLMSRVVAAARVLAIRHRQQSRSTAGRLSAVQTLGSDAPAGLGDLAQAYARAQALVLRAQLADIAQGQPPENRVPLAPLSAAERAQLKTDLGRLASLAETIRSAVF
jgi:DNA polymerase-3 subunit epsilon/CBS domain-containing protein